MNTIAFGLAVVGGFFALLFGLMVLVFVVTGAVRMVKARKAGLPAPPMMSSFDFGQLARVNPLDGISIEEQKILLDLLAAIGSDGLQILCEWMSAQKKSETATALKAKLAEVAKNA